MVALTGLWKTVSNEARTQVAMPNARAVLNDWDARGLRRAPISKQCNHRKAGVAPA